MLNVKGFLDSPLHAIHQTCKSSQLIFLNVLLKYKMSRFLQFWCKLNTRRIVKTCSFRFLHNYYGDALDFTFPQFPNHFLPFSMVFPHVSLVFLRFLRVFLLFSLSVSSVFYFRCCEYQSRSVSLVKETFGKISTSHKIL